MAAGAFGGEQRVRAWAKREDGQCEGTDCPTLEEQYDEAQDPTFLYDKCVRGRGQGRAWLGVL